MANVEIEVDSVSTYKQIKQRRANQKTAESQEELKDLILALHKDVKKVKTELKKINGGE